MTIKQSLNLIAIAVISIYFTSCTQVNKSEDNVSVDVKPQTTKVEGYLGDYLEIIDGTYKVEKDGQFIFSWVIKVKIKAKAVYDKDDYGLKDGNDGPLYLDFYDDKGTPLTSFDNLQNDYNSDSKLADILKAGGGETWVTFTKSHDYEKENLPENIKTFTVGSKHIEKEESSVSSGDSSSSDSDKSSSLSASGSKDWDKALDDYEAYVDKYIKFLKKANKGDMSAMQEYPGLMEKAQNLETSLKDAQSNNNLSEKQIEHMLKIEEKMLKAAGEMQKEK